MTLPQRDAGSFRDPSGHVFVADDRVYRTIMAVATDDFLSVRRTGILSELIAEGRVIAEEMVDKAVLGAVGKAASHVVQHPRLPFISYPYEWCFGALKDAALLQFDVHLRCLEHGVTLSDASAYNIQFLGPSPVFIDTLSFRPYRDGEIWAGHRQYCEQFLNPLLLRSLLGISHNAWYRGSMDGIPVSDIARILPIRSKFFSWNVIKHVVLHAAFQKTSTKKGSAGEVKQIRLPRAAFQGMLSSMRSWVASLEPAEHDKSVWRDYAEDNSYANVEAERKADFVREFSRATKPAVLWDLGCNTGEYSKVALNAGAGLSIGFDFDVGALERAYSKAKTEKLNFLPLHLDATNPSSSQGWAQRERKGLGERAPASAILALALVHHLAIAKNIPLDQVVDWLVGLAPAGVIEFVQKADPMVQELLRFREDIFPNYSEQDFENALKARARIHMKVEVSSAGRKLYWFERSQNLE